MAKEICSLKKDMKENHDGLKKDIKYIRDKINGMQLKVATMSGTVAIIVLLVFKFILPFFKF